MPQQLTQGRTDQAATVSSSAWTLCVALVTYLTLCRPGLPVAAFLEGPYAMPAFTVFALVCGLAPAIAGTVRS